jgi:hypothetical protein
MPRTPRLEAMKRLLLAFAMILSLGAPLAQAQAPHIYTQPELDALVAPIALYPDGLVTQILMAAKFPDQVMAASRLPKDAQPDESWDPNVKALLAFPEVLTRMAESPQWTRDLGLAFANQEPHVMDTVQSLRKRAQTNGQLQSNDQTTVTQQDQAIVVQPRNPEVVYVPYYDPYVVYGPWWWPGYSPVIWSPWVAAPVFVGAGFFFAYPHWHAHQVVVVNQTFVQRNVWVRPAVNVQRNVVVRDWQHAPASHQAFSHGGAPRYGGHQGYGSQGQHSQPSQSQHQSGGGWQQRSGGGGQHRSDAGGWQQHADARTAMPAANRFSESRPQQPSHSAATPPRGGMRGGGAGEMRAAPRGGETRAMPHGGGWGSGWGGAARANGGGGSRGGGHRG